MPKKKLKNNQSSPKRILIIAIVFIAALITISYFTKGYFSSYTRNTAQASFEFANQTYNLDGDEVKPISGNQSASIERTSTSPNNQRGAAILVSSPGGSGTFFYLIGGTQNNGKAIYSNPASLGDRIEIKSLKVTDPSENDNGIIEVKYLDRGPNDPMSTTPTIEITKTYGITEEGHLIELNT